MMTIDKVVSYGKAGKKDGYCRTAQVLSGGKTYHLFMHPDGNWRDSLGRVFNK